ncbi:MAG: hypothetical protein WBK51_09500 [Polaromonas sp.]
MNLPTSKSQIQEEALLKRCAAVPQAAIHVLNIGRSNNATTYSDAFCDAAADLIRLYRASGVADPIDRLSRQLMASKVVSCRGLPMDHAKTTYLYRTKLEQRLKTPRFAVLDKLTKSQCHYCHKWRYNIAAHIRDAHAHEPKP